MEYPSVSKLRSFINKITANVDYSITLLHSEDKAVTEQALINLSGYIDESDKNASILFKKDVVHTLSNFIKPDIDETNLALVLRLLLKIIRRVPESQERFMDTENIETIKRINNIFLTNEFDIIQELCGHILSFSKVNVTVAYHLLLTNVVPKIFSRLEDNDNTNLQLSLVKYLNSLLVALNAKDHIIEVQVLALRILFYYIRVPRREIQSTTFDIIETLISWKSCTVQKHLQEGEIMENLLNFIRDDTYDMLHDRAFKILYICCNLPETSSYFIESDEFKLFCEWLKSCEDKYIFSGAKLITLLTQNSEARERLIDISIEGTILSLLRSEESTVLCKNCQAFANLVQSPRCPRKIISNEVILYMLNALQRKDMSIIPCHEIVLKALAWFVVSRLETCAILLRHDGVNIIVSFIKPNWKCFTVSGLLSIMKLINAFTIAKPVNFVMTRDIFQRVMICFDKTADELSKLSLTILQNCMRNQIYHNFFLDFDGPMAIERKLRLPHLEDLYEHVLIFMKSLLRVRRLGLAIILKSDCFNILNSCDKGLMVRYPKIEENLRLLGKLHYPSYFHKHGQLLPENICDNGFYLINSERGFCLMENLMEIKASSYFTMYVVNFVGPPLLPPAVIEIETSDTVSTPGQLIRCMPFLATWFRIVTEMLRNLCNRRVEAQETQVMPLQPLETTIREYINYGSLSPDPYLRRFINILQQRLVDGNLLKAIEIIAKFVVNIIRYPLPIRKFSEHILHLKNYLGTSMIPIGYLRFGYGCERALLFKALADKLDVPASLVRERSNIAQKYVYWNEVSFEGQDFIVDLLDDIGELIEVGSLKAYQYCGLMRSDT